MPTDLFTPPRITLIALLNSTSHLILFTHEEILTTRPILAATTDFLL